MTQPIQEPSHDRAMQGANWGVRQLFRRPALSGAYPNIWAYMSWFDGDTVPNTTGSWYQIPTWEEFWISDDALASGALYRDPSDAFAIWYDADLGDGVWIVDTKVEWADSPPGAGTYVGVGNLISSGGSLDSLDVHSFQPADLLLTHAYNQCHNLTTFRTTVTPASDEFFTIEIGNFTGGDLDLLGATIEVVHVGFAPQTGEYSFT